MLLCGQPSGASGTVGVVAVIPYQMLVLVRDVVQEQPQPLQRRHELVVAFQLCLLLPACIRPYCGAKSSILDYAYRVHALMLQANQIDQIPDVSLTRDLLLGTCLALWERIGVSRTETLIVRPLAEEALIEEQRRESE